MTSIETAAAALDEAVVATCDALRSVADRDWSTPAQESDWSIRQVVEHIYQRSQREHGYCGAGLQ